MEYGWENRLIEINYCCQICLKDILNNVRKNKFSCTFWLKPNTFLFFSSRMDLFKQYWVGKKGPIFCRSILVIRSPAWQCYASCGAYVLKSVQNFVLARLEKIYKKNSTSVCSHAKVLWSWGVSRRKLPFPSILLCDLLAAESWHTCRNIKLNSWVKFKQGL